MHGANLPFPVQGILRAVYLVLAMLCLGMGMIGVVLPGVPTTPFLLLMSFFLLRTSPALHARVIRAPVVGRHLQDWHDHRGVRPRVKRLVYLMIGAVMAGLWIFSPMVLPAKVTVSLLATVGLVVVKCLPTVE